MMEERDKEGIHTEGKDKAVPLRPGVAQRVPGS